MVTNLKRSASLPLIAFMLVLAGPLHKGEASENGLAIGEGALPEQIVLRAGALGSDEVFQLQSNTNLSSESWVDVGDPVMGRNQSWQEIVDAAGDQSFFRLIRKNPPEAHFSLDGSLGDDSGHARTLSVSTGGTAGWASGRTGFDQAYLLDGNNTLNPAWCFKCPSLFLNRSMIRSR